MCATCGCDDGGPARLIELGAVHEHVRADGTRYQHTHDHEHEHDDHGRAHGHPHEHPHEHAHEHGHEHEHEHPHAHEHAHAHATTIDLETRVLAKNDAIADRNRAWLAGREVAAFNVVSSPGAGKTTLLERTIRELKNELPLFVIEGDQETSVDGERIRAAGAPVVQLNTGTGCHLDAEMIARALERLAPTFQSLLLIENVGNLVCPALFDLGERAKVAILSVTEGEDKPLKYPHMFRAAQLLLLSKVDLLPHVDFDPARAAAHARAVNPSITTLQVSARTGQGLSEWYDWLRGQRRAK
jgi:hydrogenase nickel incorporation protein HypB